MKTSGFHGFIEALRVEHCSAHSRISTGIRFANCDSIMSRFRSLVLMARRDDGDCVARQRSIHLGNRFAGLGKPISLVDLRLRSKLARWPFSREPYGRRFFWLRPALARSTQPAARCSLASPARTLAALAEAKIPRRRTSRNFKTHSYERHRIRRVV